MPEIPIRAYGVSVIVLREIAEGTEVLLMRRAETLVGTWCQIAGGIETGESAWQAALRELKEETGLHPTAFYSADTCEQFYEPDRDCIAMFPVFVAYVSPDANVVLNSEHTAHRWMSFHDARNLVSFGGQRRVLEWVENEFVTRVPSPYLRIEGKTVTER